MKALRAQRDAEIENAKIDEMDTSKTIARVKALGTDSAELKALFNELSSEYGVRAAETALTKDALAKELRRPVDTKSAGAEQRKNLHQIWDYLLVGAALFKGIQRSEGIHRNGEAPISISKTIVNELLNRFEAEGVEGVNETLIKGINDALDNATATEGYEFVPLQVLSRTLNDGIWLQNKLYGIFPRYQMAGPIFDMPLLTARGRLYRMTQSKAYSDYFTNKATPHGFETDKVRWEAEKVAANILYSDELVQDSVVPIIQRALIELNYAFAYGYEDAVINGATSLSTLDNAGTDTNRLWNNTADAGDGIRLNTGAIDIRNTFEGLRRAAVACSNTISGATNDVDLYFNMRKSMGKYGTDHSGLVLAVSPATYINLLKFDEIQTMEKYQGNATLVQGELARLGNIPIVVSPCIAENLNASGVFDNATTTKTVAIMFRQDAFAWGDRAATQVETGRNPLSGQSFVLGTARIDFQCQYATSEKVVCVAYNMAV
jgi:HK97 family phage major capsid protein